MPKSMLRALFLAALCLGLTAAPCAAGGSAEAAPAVTDPLAESGPMSVLGPMDVVRLVAASRGKVTVFSFWASWCAPCRTEIPELNEVRRAFGKDDLLLVGLSVDEDPVAYSKFVVETRFDYPVRRVSDSVSSLYRVGTIPRLVVYDSKGELAVSHEGLVEAEELKALVSKLLSEK